MKYIAEYQIQAIFKTVSYNGGLRYKTPKRPTDDVVLSARGDRYLSRLIDHMNAEADNACISGKLMSKRKKHTPIIEPITPIESKEDSDDLQTQS